MYLYPRLPASAAASLIRGYRLGELKDLREHSDTSHPATIYTAVGGSRVDKTHLDKIRKQLFNIADKLNWPDPLASNAERNRFDNLVAVVLHKHMAIVPAEAARDDVWSFITCVLVPDLVRWRFPGGEKGTPHERFVGGVRNTLQRLWWRGHVFSNQDDSRPYRLLQQLGEDELVQIMERPVLRGNKKLVNLVAGRLIAVAGQANNNLPRMRLMREVAKRMVRHSSHISLDALTPIEMERMVSSVFENVQQAMLSKKKNG